MGRNESKFQGVPKSSQKFPGVPRSSKRVPKILKSIFMARECVLRKIKHHGDDPMGMNTQIPKNFTIGMSKDTL